MKKIFFGLLVGGVALSANSFIMVKSLEDGNIYVGRSPGVYAKLSPTEEYLEFFCLDEGNFPCSFIQTDNVDYPEQLVYSEICNLPFIPGPNGIYSD